MKPRMTLGVLLLALTLVTPLAFAKDAYYQIKFSELSFTEGALPGPEEDRMMPWRLAQNLYPEVRVEDNSEAYVAGVIHYWNWDIDLRENGLVHVRAPAGEDVVGELRIPHLTSTEAGQTRLKFRIPAKAAGKHKEAFQKARRAHYQRLMDMGVPGAAWFRHQRDMDRPKALIEELTPEQRRQRRVDDLNGTYDLFSGGRALSENLQLDRVLLPRGGSKELVDISTLKGITINEIKASVKEGVLKKFFNKR